MVLICALMLRRRERNYQIRREVAIDTLVVGIKHKVSLSINSLFKCDFVLRYPLNPQISLRFLIGVAKERKNVQYHCLQADFMVFVWWIQITK